MIPFPYTNKDGREFISHQPERNAEGSGNVGAFDAQTSELLGGCGFRGLEAERTEFGYWVASAERGRGIAPRALILLAIQPRWTPSRVKPAFSATRWEAVFSTYRVQLEPLGDGVLDHPPQEVRGERRDMVSYSLLA